MMEDSKGAAYSRAIKLLSKQDYSEFKIKTKLQAIGLDKDQIDLAIDKIKRENFLNDERYQNNLVRKLIHKGYSSLYIQKKLELEGICISEEDIHLTFEELKIGSKDQIKMLMEKKLPGNTIIFKSEIEKQKTIKKLLNFILAKGHEFEETLAYIEDHL